MPVLSDKWIKQDTKSKGMIRPFISNKLKGKNFFWLIIIWL